MDPLEVTMSDVHEDIWDIFLHVFDSLHPSKLNYMIFIPLKKYLSGVENYPYVGKICHRMLGSLIEQNHKYSTINQWFSSTFHYHEFVLQPANNPILSCRSS